MAFSPRLWIKNVHNWVGLGSALFLVALLATGVLLNHPARIPGADREVLTLAADPFSPGRLWRGTAQSLEVSPDNGATWEEVPMAFAPLEVVSIGFQPGGRGMVVLQRWLGPLLSEDGVVWAPVEMPFDPLSEGVELRAASLDGAGTLHLLTSQGALFRATDGQWRLSDFDLGRRNWTRIVRALHNGHFFGPWFVKVYDAASAALLLLIITGIVLWRVKSS